MPPSKSVGAFILAGGKSSRMGRDKAFVALDGLSLLARSLALARSVAPDVRIVGSPQKFSAYAPTVEDVFQDCGPLAGIHAALSASSADFNLILAVDMPFITSAFLHYLIEMAHESPAACATVPLAAGRWQPLCAVYRRDFARHAQQALSAGHYKIDPLFRIVKARFIGPEELESRGFSDQMFRNLNAPEDLESLKSDVESDAAPEERASKRSSENIDGR